MLECYGEQGRRAFETVEAGSVKRSLEFVVVVGTRGEYIVEDDSAPASAPRSGTGSAGTG